MQVAGWILADANEDVAAKCRLAELPFTPAARADSELILRMPNVTTKEWASLERQLPQTSVTGLTSPHGSINRAVMEQVLEVHRYARVT